MYKKNYNYVYLESSIYEPTSDLRIITYFTIPKDSRFFLPTLLHLQITPQLNILFLTGFTTLNYGGQSYS